MIILSLIEAATLCAGLAELRFLTKVASNWAGVR